MISVVIIGGGNVACHLINRFLATSEVVLKQVVVRNPKVLVSLKNILAITDNFNAIALADIYIIAISDDAIISVSSKIDKKGAFVVHTSGTVTMDALQNRGRKGVFYPLQSFSKAKKVDFTTIPFCLEAQNKEDLNLLENLTFAIGAKSYILNSSQRKRLHLAAVFVNNFVNHLYTIGKDICDKNNIPFEMLHPLIEQTALKVRNLPPELAQTGPARRKDNQTVKNHLALVSGEQKKIYTLLTQSIQKMDNNYKVLLAQIDTLIFDVDGVLTNGTVTVMPDGQLIRQMNIKDGYALKCATAMGLRVVIISGGKNKGVQKRLEGLGITDIYLGVEDKMEPFNELTQKYRLNLDNILYMGDDIPDYPVMKLVGLPCCPKDASPEIQHIARYVSYKNGGEGCVRDIVEQILRIQGKWNGNIDASEG